jgi:hypothetical protein
MRETFRQDREWHTTDDLPSVDDVKTLQDKYAYQRILRRKWEATEIPSELTFAPMDGEWWQRPYDPDPAALLQQQLRRLKRQ